MSYEAVLHFISYCSKQILRFWQLSRFRQIPTFRQISSFNEQIPFLTKKILPFPNNYTRNLRLKITAKSKCHRMNTFITSPIKRNTICDLFLILQIARESHSHGRLTHFLKKTLFICIRSGHWKINTPRGKNKEIWGEHNYTKKFRRKQSQKKHSTGNNL